MSRFARRKDFNQREVEDALRAAGWQVSDLSFAGRGVPDLLAASACDPAPITLLVEVKMLGEKLTEAETRFHKTFRGNIMIVDSGTCAVVLANQIRERHLGVNYV